MTDPCAGFDPKHIVLSKGGHGETFTGEVCLLEAANRLTVCCPKLAAKYGKAERFAARHPSICPVVQAFGIAFNDTLEQEDRQRLAPYAKKVLGTKTTTQDTQTRAWMATDWLVRVHTPAFLRLAGLTQHAQALESLARIVDGITCGSAQPTLDAAYSAARSAADSAAYSAADSAARSAADSAADSAAYSAADSAARSAAYSAAYSAARSAADSAARSAAYSAARSAAYSAAYSALAPTADILRDSAFQLFDAMIAVGRDDS